MDEQRWERRNVVAGAAAGMVAVLVGQAALAPAADARARKQPPLAVVAGALVDTSPSTGGSFTWVFHGAVVHIASGAQTKLDTTMGVDATALTDPARAKIVRALQSRGAAALLGLGQTVPDERIAVTVL